MAQTLNTTQGAFGSRLILIFGSRLILTAGILSTIHLPTVCLMLFVYLTRLVYRLIIEVIYIKYFHFIDSF